ncbi:hypothetical protein [Burkholderia cepacia]|uniref:phosphoribosyltransferase-like protein n=1 Tax=Burkholderia cepacia TaxID=292 RepID=UPI0012D8CDC9|nr:hypothetical protein [Burkholderia cepacia]
MAELRAAALTWEDAVKDELRNWTRGGISANSLRTWLAQFDRLCSDSHKWVGELLLKSLAIRSADDLANDLYEHATTHSLLDASLCILRYENGKSADALSSVIKKRFSHRLKRDLELLNWFELLQQPRGREGTSHVIFEDGLFTGVELAGIIYALAGRTAKKGVIALDRLDNLTEPLINFVFGIATDVGLDRLRTCLTALGMNAVVSAVETLTTLNDEGNVRLQEGTLYSRDPEGKEIVMQPDQVLKAGVFDNAKVFSTKNREKAISLCKRVGVQLWESNLRARSKSWSAERINDCALGAGNMALAFAFAHSVPKSTLPVFWCHGDVVDSKGNSFAWEPLFPDAHL